MGMTTRTCISFEYASMCPHDGHFSDTCIIPKCSKGTLQWTNAPTHQGTLVASLVVLRLRFSFLPKRGRERLWVGPCRDDHILVRWRRPCQYFSVNHVRYTYNSPAPRVHTVRKLLSFLRLWEGRAASRNQDRTRGNLYSINFLFAPP